MPLIGHRCAPNSPPICPECSTSLPPLCHHNSLIAQMQQHFAPNSPPICPQFSTNSPPKHHLFSSNSAAIRAQCITHSSLHCHQLAPSSMAIRHQFISNLPPSQHQFAGNSTFPPSNSTSMCPQFSINVPQIHQPLDPNSSTICTKCDSNLA